MLSYENTTDTTYQMLKQDFFFLKQHLHVEFYIMITFQESEQRCRGDHMSFKGYHVSQPSTAKNLRVHSP